MSDQRTFPVKKGDQDTLDFVLSDANGPVLLDTAQRVDLTYVVGTTSYTVQCEIVGVPQTGSNIGRVRYRLTPTDYTRLVRGPYKCESFITWPDGSTSHFPLGENNHNIIKVEPTLS